MLLRGVVSNPEGQDVMLSLCQQLGAKEDLAEEDRRRMGRYLCESLDWGMDSVRASGEGDG